MTHKQTQWAPGAVRVSGEHDADTVPGTPGRSLSTPSPTSPTLAPGTGSLLALIREARVHLLHGNTKAALDTLHAAAIEARFREFRLWDAVQSLEGSDRDSALRILRKLLP